jgi:hypothetical protein
VFEEEFIVGAIRRHKKVRDKVAVVRARAMLLLFVHAQLASCRASLPYFFCFVLFFFCFFVFCHAGCFFLFQLAASSRQAPTRSWCTGRVGPSLRTRGTLRCAEREQPLIACTRLRVAIPACLSSLLTFAVSSLCGSA